MNEDFITARIVLSRGIKLDVVAQTTTTLFKEGNTYEQNKSDAEELIAWLRDVADQWEDEFKEEFSA